VLETKLVVSAAPFHWTVDEDRKLYPVRVSVNAALPAVAELGLSETMAGTGFGEDWPPPDPADPPLLPHAMQRIKEARHRSAATWMPTFLGVAPGIEPTG